MKLLTKKQLEKLTTKRLLSYKNSLMQVHEKTGWWAGYEASKSNLTKESVEWKETYKNLKEILATREHIE